MSGLVHAVVIVFVLWLLLGALPQMHRDAAARLPQVRGLARERMRAHAKRARKDRRLKSAEWLGWGLVAVTAEGARFGGYLVRSAWRGWGDHRRRGRDAVARVRGRWFPEEAEPSQAGETVPPEPPQGPPPDGGSPGPVPGPPREETVPPLPWVPPQAAAPVPAGVAPVTPIRPGLSLVPDEGEEMSGEINNLEAAVQVVRAMQERAARSLENAIEEKTRTAQALAGAEQSAGDLAAAGVSGPAWEAFVRYHEAVETADHAAASMVTACEMACAAADSARGALVKHQEAAEQLAATGGAADQTGWYNAG